MDNFLPERLGLIAYLALKCGWIGRTTLMKFCYFLQILKRVPLGYGFSLYSYGPFDSTVLSDLSDCESLGLVKEELVFQQVGYGYRISGAVSDREAETVGGDLVRLHRDSIEWVIREFGPLSAAQLELASTIVYVDREASNADEALSVSELARKVRDVKPHFSEQQIVSRVEWLRNRNLLEALV